MIPMSRKTLVRLGAVAMLALPFAAQAKPNRSVDSVHQPVISHSAFIYDVQAGPDGGLTASEARRLDDWFMSIGLGYGDQVAIVTDAYDSPALRDGISDVVARHGMLVGEDGSAAAGAAPEGSVRLVVRRATASVPSCPDWSGKSETSWSLGGGSNYGCGVNGTLAAMMANPEDLVRGQSTESDLRTATSNRAISTYREKTPTGSGDLKNLGR